MSKVCKNCGAKLPDDDNFCVICDKYVDAIDDSELGLDKQESTFAVYNKPTSVILEKKSKISSIILAIIGIAIIIGTIYYFSNLKNFQYKNAVGEFYDTIFAGNETAYRDLVLPPLVTGDNYRVEKKYLDISSLKVDNKLSYKILSASKVDGSDVDVMVGNIGKIYDGEVKLSGVYEIEVEINGKQKEISYTETIYVVKFNGKQYIYFE